MGSKMRRREEGPGKRPVLRAFRRRVGFSGVLSDTLSNIFAGLLVVLFGGIILSNSTFQFSLFTRIRNAFISPASYYSRMANIRGVALDDETSLKLSEFKAPATVYDALAEGIKAIDAYAATVPDRRVVIGVDYILSGIGKAGDLDKLADSLSGLGSNVFVVLGAALNQAGTNTSYFRYDLYRDRLIAGVIARKGEVYARGKIFAGNLHLLKGNAVSGFQELENTDIALGYVPVFDQGGAVSCAYYSLAFMMYSLGELVPQADLAAGRFSMSQDGYLSPGVDADTWLDSAVGHTQAYFSNKPFRYNFFSANDLSSHPYFRFNYFPLGRLSKDYDTSGQAAMSLRESIDGNNMALEVQGVDTEKKTNTDYFVIFRAMSLGYIGPGASADVVVTPASSRDPFTNTMEQVSGAMTHIVALSNLINREYIIEAPLWLDKVLTIILALFCLWIGLHAEFRTIILTSAGMAAGVLLLGYILFIFNVFFACRLPLIVSLGILMTLASGRFLVSVEGDCD
jgi:hypothetical protein